MDRESQIRAIEKTFEDALLPIEKHHSKPNVYPVEILPFFPDFQTWKYSCLHVQVFDSASPSEASFVPTQIEKMSQGYILYYGEKDEYGRMLLSYFVPTQETLVKRRVDLANNREYKEKQKYEYKKIGEYRIKARKKDYKVYNRRYFLVEREDGMYYNEIENRGRIKKRKLKRGEPPSQMQLVMTHRPLTKMECQKQRNRESELEPPRKEEEF